MLVSAEVRQQLSPALKIALNDTTQLQVFTSPHDVNAMNLQPQPVERRTDPDLDPIVHRLVSMSFGKENEHSELGHIFKLTRVYDWHVSRTPTKD